MRRTYLLTLLLIALVGSFEAHAQAKSGYKIQNAGDRNRSGRGAGAGDFFDNVYIQPGFGLAFGSNQIYWEVAPTVGYRITDLWDAGVGLSYAFSKSEVPGTVHYRANTIGTNLFTRYLIADPIFVMTRYEVLGTKFEIIDTGLPVTADESRQFYNAFLAGGGIMQSIGRNGAFVLSVLYNFSYDDSRPFDNGPYSSPIVINTGFMISL